MEGMTEPEMLEAVACREGLASKKTITAGAPASTTAGGVLAFADRLDVLLMALGTLGAVADGCSYNLLLVFASDVVNSLGRGHAAAQQGGASATTTSGVRFMRDVEKSCLSYVYLALAVLPVAFLEGYCWSRTSERQVRRIRCLYLQAMLRQEPGFFDSGDAAATAEIVGGISKDAAVIQEVPLFLMHSTAFISGLAFSIYLSWRLALAASPLVLLLVIPGLIYGKDLVHLSRKSRHEYAKANFLVEQALGSIKTVYSFTAEKRIIQRYATVLDGTIKLGIKQGIAKGLAVGCTGIAFAIWAFLAWYGSRLVMFQHESGWRIYAAAVSFVLGGLSLGVALPELKHLTEASIAATRILEQINRVSQINADDSKGLMLDRLRGGIKFADWRARSIAVRAVIRNPVILLLDEATSALDSESEMLVQHALDKASMGRTTPIVAHKLSTVKNADQIAVLDGGTIAEIGTHDELINKGGPYARLVKLQKMMNYINQESEQLRASSTTRTSTSGPNVSSASPMPVTKTVSIKDDYAIPPPAPSFFKLVAMNAPEWRQAVIGSLYALVYGVLQPIYATTIGSMVAAFFVQDYSEMNAIISRSALIFCSLSLISIVVNLLQHYNFAYMGVHLVRRIRIQVLEKILTFEAAWFDEETNSSGSLCSQLSNEASLVKTLVADRISLLLQTVSGTVTAVTMGLALAWKLALVMIAVQPSTMICYYAKKTVLANVSRDLAKAQHQSTQIAIEGVYNHRMVTSFGCSSKVLQLFEHAQVQPLRKGRKMAWVAGITTGLSPCLLYLSWALDFWYGGKLVQSGEISAADFFKTYFILMTTGKLIAEAGSMTSDLAKGANAIASVFEVLDRKSPQNLQVGKDDQANKIQGRIEFKKVDFAYPTRPQCVILKDFSFDVKAGSSVGLVGKSGCGKSTIIGLIQRFYDVARGAVCIDGIDVRDINIPWYRGQAALVSQEPAIFSCSVRDNIAFGKPKADEDEIVEAAKAANAHEFISSLKDGYDTDCGEHGIELSGGQKQRIAIARAITRNPAILLLDEATSALDAQSEKMVQEALDRIMSGRTTIVVAHRLKVNSNDVKKNSPSAPVMRLQAGSQSHQAALCGAWDPAGDDSGRRPASDRPWNPGGRTQASATADGVRTGGAQVRCAGEFGDETTLGPGRAGRNAELFSEILEACQ
ncbi:putative ABC transporter B family member 8 [Panicum miliaceum]|uniref:ABC transporter B family member 8 n=1 Tax=Panicum miliaceum TaxID=4540 RepID=A0A3L6PYY6_PANMI|nr:putative ABC transporter B family member 8 [Panicum miliaceum]